jgi:hypothetical protein
MATEAEKAFRVPQDLWPLLNGIFGGSSIVTLHMRIQFVFYG